jgi:hypothetical protein
MIEEPMLNCGSEVAVVLQQALEKADRGLEIERERIKRNEAQRIKCNENLDHKVKVVRLDKAFAPPIGSVYCVTRMLVMRDLTFQVMHTPCS